MLSEGGESLCEERDRIADTFAGKGVLITGGTGFLGQALIEKLLRTSSDIGAIYLLIRKTKSEKIEDRIEKIFASPLFEPLRKVRPEAIQQIKAIHGDISLKDLGISKEDRDLLINQVHIVYHCAASTRFDDSLKRAVLLNLRATKSMLDLAQDFKHLQLFVHVSTAYSQVLHNEVHERIYDSPADPELIIRMTQEQSNDALTNFFKEDLKRFPNTYIFTKAIAESLVAKRMKSMPCIIVRPSIIMPTYVLPITGWISNLHGPLGLLIAASKGVLRSMYYPKNTAGDIIPVDLCVNYMIAVTWNFISNKDIGKVVFNLTTSSERSYTWKEIFETARDVVMDVPLDGVVWYPGGSMKQLRITHNLCCVLQHWIPAYIIDAGIFLSGNERCMVKIQNRISNGLEALEYFTCNEWDFINDNVISIRSKLNNLEKTIHKIDTDGFDIRHYIENILIFTRVNIFKTSVETLPAARRHIKMLWWIELIFKLFCVWALFYMVKSYVF